MTWDRNQLFRLLVTATLTSLFCIGLYTFNNKYTHKGIQPDHGQLIVSTDDLDQVHYLINDWEFYPGVLLSPDQLQSKEHHHYMVYMDIGSHTRFDNLGTSTSPHGCGTYAMHLWLPEGMNSYALELPEIYSAYRLYINGHPYLQTGVPEPENYSARTQAKYITFQANGQADIVLAVSDYSHYYSGMVYPPLFGLPEQVMQWRDIQQSLTQLAIAAGLILCCITGYLGIRIKRPNAILFSILGLIACFTIGFPFLHRILELPVFPWYMLELLCIYLMPLLVLILHNRVCHVEPTLRRFSIGLAIIMCIWAAFYALLADALIVPIMKAFSWLVLFYKITVAIYLLFTAFDAMKNDTLPAPSIFFATASYATFFVWDRILPEFEPILYGWFMDWGNLVLILAIGFHLIHDMAATYSRSLKYAEEHRQMHRLMTMQSQYTKQLSEQSEKNRRLIHDFRQHLRTISVLSDRINASPDTREIQQELHTYLQNATNTTYPGTPDALETFSSNPAVDALLQYYYSYAKQQNIDVSFQLMPAKLRLPDIEYCTILGNLLENAIEACIRLPKKNQRSIQLQSHETEHLLFIRIENTYDGLVLKENQHLASRKSCSSQHGIGISSVTEIVERHGGTIDTYPMAHVFRIGISLPLL